MMNYGKIPPQNRDIEKAVLGALLIDNNCLNNGMVKLFPEIFYVEAHGLIFHAILIRSHSSGDNIKGSIIGSNTHL